MTFNPRAAMKPVIGALLVTFMAGTWLLFTNSPLRDRARSNESLDDSCALIELSRPTSAASPARPDGGSLQQTAVTRRFEANSRQCWDVNVQGFEGVGVVVAVTAAGRLAAHQLAQLTAVLADNSEAPDTAVVIQPLADDVPRATWYYVLPNGQRTRILLANVATETLPQVAVTFTALRSLAWMGTGSGGPPTADMGGLLELDSVFGLVSPSPQYMGLVDHCFLTLNARSTTGTGDRVIVHLTHPGRIGPGIYDIAGADRPDIMPAEDVPGRATGAFSIGVANAHAAGLDQDFWFHSGVLEITSISDRLVQGVVRANGWRRQNQSWERGPEGLAELSMVASFAVVANDRGELLASETRIHDASYAGIWRRWTHECLQQPPPPVSTADDDSEQDPDDRTAPDNFVPDDSGSVQENPSEAPSVPPSIFCWRDCVPARFCWKDCVRDDARRDPGEDAAAVQVSQRSLQRVNRHSNGRAI